jgi:hypothetical protein
MDQMDVQGSSEHTPFEASSFHSGEYSAQVKVTEINSVFTTI